MSQISWRTILVVLIGMLLFSNPTQAAEIKTGNAAFDRKANETIKVGTAHIRGNIVGSGGAGQKALACYALLKAGEPTNSPVVQQVLNLVLKKFNGSNGYRASAPSKEVYEAGIDAMLLEAIDADQFRAELTALVQFISKKQLANGGWDYPNGLEKKFVGDTSMAQYAMLGLWAAQRANIPINLSVVDKCAAWHIRTQRQDGGFAYHPGLTHEAGTGSGNSTGNMSAGGASSLGICKLLLYPKQDGDEKKSGGVLEGVRKKKSEVKRTYNATVSKGAIEKAMARSYGWVTNRLLPAMNGQTHAFYYFYTMERAAALNAKKDDLGWYTTLATQLFKMPQDNGSFKAHDGDLADTSFAVLFLLRPTAKLVEYKGGILKSKRGLPSDLSMAFDPDAKPEEKKRKLDPLESLLAALEKADLGDTSDKDAEALKQKQADIVKKIQNGNREDLIGQVDRLKGLAKHPHPDVRRTALWALGRSGDLMVAPLLIKGLKDVDVDVMVEARNALCFVSRRANGFNLEPNPLAEMESASADEKAKAAFEWSEKASKLWLRWWFKVRPYELRDDLEEAALGGG